MDAASTWWLLAGAAFMALEAFGIPGLGFVFGGLAAIIVGGLLVGGVLTDDALLIQFALWFGMTVVMAALLWKPMKRWRLDPESKDKFSNMVGDTAVIIGGPLKSGTRGKAKWSGTTMTAELSPDAETPELADGETAEIVDVKGTVLILAPRTPLHPER